jgi:phospholipase A1
MSESRRATGLFPLALALALLGPAAAGASPAAETPASCAEVEDDALRLRCYDERAEDDGGEEREPETSIVIERWILEERASGNSFALLPHRPNYILPVAYSDNPNEAPYEPLGGFDLEKTEVKFQLSIKARLWDGVFGGAGDLWLAYTQLSLWQAYSSSSSPFRETNYEPELLLVFPRRWKLGGLHGRAVTFGLNHTSNGRSGSLSRSWNRITASALFDKDRFALLARAWYRIPDSVDDNPDIESYVGRAELLAAYKPGRQVLAMRLRHNLELDRGRGSLQLHWSVPLSSRLKLYTQLFHGYGESLIDYDYSQTRFGVGLLFSDWL